MTFQEEQDRFQKEIDKNFISVYDLVNQLMEEKELDFKNASLFILTRINAYLTQNDNQIFFTLTEPPFTAYTLESLWNSKVTECLEFASRNGRFRSEKKAKTYGILRSEINIALNSTFAKTENSQSDERKYNSIERETHLQMIAILAEELANHCQKYKKANGLPNNSAIANLIAERAMEIRIESLEPKGVDGYRRRLTEISSYYKGE
ncbi:hypothetical protein E4T80_11600 [Muribacter muris]|uniref:Uncharacterized protein n=1 Tax=Muribacter muris TaxID=67855 RepID=A0A4Y9JTW3_9PAST|nr:hypothetical protein [Muribacter muris]MBF0786106.1 hypothetical protein [Muribacter muris]MBF0826473.1 hypothetical protein [Muribacter muris]TFV07945.1 hypothetical protein E4T80_11600 [Muribacter muris]